MAKISKNYEDWTPPGSAIPGITIPEPTISTPLPTSKKRELLN